MDDQQMKMMHKNCTLNPVLDRHNNKYTHTQQQQNKKQFINVFTITKQYRVLDKHLTF